MDNKNKILVLLSLSGVIIVSVSAFYIPSVGGTVPLGMNPQEFQKQQREFLSSEKPLKFKIDLIMILNLISPLNLIKPKLPV